MESRIIELEFEKAISDLFEIGRIDGVNSGKNYGRNEFEARKGSRGWVFMKCNGVPDFYVRCIFNIRNEETDFTGAQDICWLFIGREDSHFIHFKCFLVRHESNERFFT